jgi:hypothetical protein
MMGLCVSLRTVLCLCSGCLDPRDLSVWCSHSLCYTYLSLSFRSICSSLGGCSDCGLCLLNLRLCCLGVLFLCSGVGLFSCLSCSSRGHCCAYLHLCTFVLPAISSACILKRRLDWYSGVPVLPTSAGATSFDASLFLCFLLFLPVLLLASFRVCSVCL